ncbi:hypothetical protein TanjilG_18972 [Lupinus angustifolius]|uniref:Uncharacterized protein n=1 Tax=Lupinus angustifolius TaxID=3871 RepID=A0A4P1RQS2_LUPAN|nr:PREDICTED: uncharacterized protein LOC109329290 [Lupinus angustifolius]OIW16257.1 hypothetical protein TanjilG_18972 [Lupinus angustifolius]
MSFRLFSGRGMAHEDGNIRTLDSFNQMMTDHQPLEIHSRSSRTILRTNHKISYPNNNPPIVQNTNLMMQGYQNYPNPRNSSQPVISFMSAHRNYLSANNSILGTNMRIQGNQNYPTLNDFIQGSSYGNGAVGATTRRTMVPLVTYSSDNGYTMLAATNGAFTLLYLPKDTPPNTVSNNVPPTIPSHVVASAGNSTLNNVPPTLPSHVVASAGNSTLNNIPPTIPSHVVASAAGNSSLNNNVNLQGDTRRETERVVIDLDEESEENEDSLDLSLHL